MTTEQSSDPRIARLLDEVITPKSPESDTGKVLDLARLRPAEVVALFRTLVKEDTALHNGSLPRGTESAYGSMLEDLQTALADLTQHNLEHARAIYAAFAESPIADDREYAGYSLDRITNADHDFGFQLWDQLIRDPHPGVRENAFHTLDTDGFGHEEAATELGLTWYDAARLLRAYMKAEEGSGLHDPSENALHRLTNPDMGATG